MDQTATSDDDGLIEQLLLLIEDALRRGPGGFEMRPELRLPEYQGCTFRGGYLTMTRTKVTYGPGIREARLTWSAPRAIANVLAMRAADPHAAHARDLADAARSVSEWRYNYERAAARLAGVGASKSFSHPDGQPIYGLAVDSYMPLCPLHDRELYSVLLVRALQAQDSLAARGPILPAQETLF